MAKRLTVAIDTGGTFTDCVYRHRGRLAVIKIASTPEDPGAAVLQAIDRIAELTGATDFEVRHGTTVATNALLERKGARVAFVTTEGFEDTLAIARQARPALYDWDLHRPEPLAPAELCFGAPERIGADGSVVRALTAAGVRALVEKVRAAQPESIAVSLLFSFANPKHEELLAAALRRLHLPLSLSHRILPEFREFERAATVTLNAYVAPRMAGYIERLQQGLQQRRATLSIMQSSGGILSARAAAEEPVRTILSGPAGGVMGALHAARSAGVARIISFDMGGTSTDVALLEGDRDPVTTVEGEVSGVPVRVPMLDIHTAGAGGGSLACMDAAGALQVGPQSAGARPGPACYGTGEGATVTDADLVLGRLHPDHFLGGAMRLHLDRARAALERLHAQTNGFRTVEALAEGIVRVANARMESALRRVSVERGHDPRSYALLAFGGAGPLHACALAGALRIDQVVVPVRPGALSAAGILDADLRREFSRTVMDDPAGSSIEPIFQALEEEARATFQEQGVTPALARSADLRYRGQGFELRVDWTRDAAAAFHALHQRSFGYADRDRAVEVVTLRVQAVARARHPQQKASPVAATNSERARLAAHRIYELGRWRTASLYDRERLTPGARFAGPALIVELSATTYVPSGWLGRIDRFANMLLSPATTPKTKRRRV